MSQLDALSKLAQTVPGLNKRAAQQQQAGQRIQARTAAAKAPPTASTTEVAQTVAPKSAQAQGAAGLQAQAQTQKQLGQLGQQAVQEREFQGQQKLAGKELQQRGQLAEAERVQRKSIAQQELGVERKITNQEIRQAKQLQKYGIEQDNKLLQFDMKIRKDLNKIGTDLESKIFDARRQFEKDERGRKFGNERQLADYAITHAQSEQEFDNKMQLMAQSAKKKQLILESVHNKFVQTLKNEEAMKQAGLDAESKRLMAQWVKQYEEKKAKAGAQAAGIGMIASGAATGFAVGGPWGAAAGAGIGLGGAIASGSFS